MRHHLLHFTIAMAPSSSVRKPSNPQTPPPQHRNCLNFPSICRQFPSTTLDLLICIVVLFSGAFLIISYFSYLFQSLSLILPSFSTIIPYLSSNSQSQIIVSALFVTTFVACVVSFEICCRYRSRRCGKRGCKGLNNALEFDLQLQDENLLRSGNDSKLVRDVNELPWKGGLEDNPDYECLRAELRKMAPQNGQAVLLFRKKCGCPVAKLEGWGPKQSRRQKK